MAVVQTGSLLSFSITSLVQLTRMGSLAGFLDNSKSLLGIAAGLGLATISDNNIGQWLPFPPYPLPNVVLQVQKNIERKVDIIVATLKEGKRGRAFF